MADIGSTLSKYTSASELSNLLESDKAGIYFAKTYLALDGVTDDYDDLYALINTTINGADAEIWFKDGTCLIGTSITMPSNIKIVFLNGAMLSPDSGKTITINGTIQAGLHQIFTGNGTIAVSYKTKEVYPEWYGAVFDGVTDDRSAIIKTFASGLNVLLQNKTYAFSGILTLTLNNVEVKCDSGYATFKALTSATLPSSTGATTGVISITGSNFTIKNVDIDGQGTYLERPIQYSDYDNGWDTWYNTRLKTRPVLVLTNCEEFELYKVKCSYGSSGFNLKNCTDFELRRCESSYTLADSFFITDNSCYGKVTRCKAKLNGDDAFSCVIDTPNNAPHDIIFDSCEAIDVQGGLVCMHGCYNTTMINSTGINVKRCSVRLGGLTTGDGSHNAGYNQIVDNCNILMDDYVGGDDPVSYGNYVLGSGIITSASNNSLDTAKNIKILNTTFKRVNGSTNFSLYTNYASDVKISGCTFDNVGLKVLYSKNVEIDSSCKLDLIDALYLYRTDTISILANIINNKNLYHIHNYDTDFYSNIVTYNSKNVKILGNTFTHDGTISDFYELEIHAFNDAAYQNIDVDFTSIKTYAQTAYKLRYKGIFNFKDSDIEASSPLVNFDDGQFFFNRVTGEFYMNNAGVKLLIVDAIP